MGAPNRETPLKLPQGALQIKKKITNNFPQFATFAQVGDICLRNLGELLYIICIFFFCRELEKVTGFSSSLRAPPILLCDSLNKP